MTYYARTKADLLRDAKAEHRRDAEHWMWYCLLLWAAFDDLEEQA